MRTKRTPWQKEWDSLVKKEAKLAAKKLEAKPSRLNGFLEQKVPPNLQDTLDTAFEKAFRLVFQKGTAVIEKTYNKTKMEQDFDINSHIEKVKKDSKSLKTFSKTAGKKGTGNLVFSGVSGVGLGVLGIGIPDIVLFVAVMLKSIYEISLSYGYDYNTDKEKQFILLLIRAALGKDDFEQNNAKVDRFIENGKLEVYQMDFSIEQTSALLSKELLYMKFLQGVPIVGAVGGAYDFVYTKQILDYAKIKYYKRFLADRKPAEKKVM